MKKELWITFFIAVILVLGVNLLQITKNQPEETYFFVDTPIEYYNALMSEYPGFPFIVKCNHNQAITIEEGTLKDEKGNSIESSVSCNTILYWDDLEKETVTITFQSNDTSMKKQTFQLMKDEKNNYILEKTVKEK